MNYCISSDNHKGIIARFDQIDGAFYYDMSICATRESNPDLKNRNLGCYPLH
ncbi:hypothetical protein LSAJ112_120001 [Latilactobacillus sakei]|nr:hypothetical protein LSAJ112_120001 [Latilactobacillus sakei]